jgi:quercetin dioxygenase-like cupin family protein
MAIDLYRGFTNKITGETFRCISSKPSFIRFEWIVEPGGYVPFEHVHLNQDEIFHVKHGEMRIRINGIDNLISEGQDITVPKGSRHIAFNNKSSELQCEVEFRPGLDTYTFFQCFAGLTLNRDTSKHGTVNIPKMLYFARKMKAKSIARPANIPAPIFYLALHFYYLVGTVAGWRKEFERYTGIK